MTGKLNVKKKKDRKKPTPVLPTSLRIKCKSCLLNYLALNMCLSLPPTTLPFLLCSGHVHYRFCSVSSFSQPPSILSSQSPGTCSAYRTFWLLPSHLPSLHVSAGRGILPDQCVCGSQSHHTPLSLSPGLLGQLQHAQAPGRAANRGPRIY